MDEGEKKLTLKQWQVKSRLTVQAFAREIKVDARTLRNAMIVGNPVHETTVLLIIDGMKRYFARYPEYAEGYKIPESAEDFKDLVIYDPEKHRKSTAGIKLKKEVEQQ